MVELKQEVKEALSENVAETLEEMPREEFTELMEVAHLQAAFKTIEDSRNSELKNALLEEIE